MPTDDEHHEAPGRRQIEFQDPDLAEAIRAFFEDLGPRCDPAWHAMLTAAFRSGWRMCLLDKMGPAVDLCLWFMRFSTLQAGSEPAAQVVLTRDVLETLFEKCKAVVGNPDLVALTTTMEAVSVDDEPGEPQ